MNFKFDCQNSSYMIQLQMKILQGKLEECRLQVSERRLSLGTSNSEYEKLRKEVR